MRTVTIPNIQLTLEQLIEAIRQLEPEARSEVVKALVGTEMDARLTEMINSLASRSPADDISKADISAEVQAVRDRRRPSC